MRGPAADARRSGPQEEAQRMDSKGFILVVDDDPDIVATSRIILESNGYEVQTAHNGKEALEILGRVKPDVMLLDVMMASDTEGFDLAFKLREDPEYKDLPIIMLTAFLDKVRTEGPGPFEFILGEQWPVEWLFEKPLDTKKLLAKIEAILKSKHGSPVG
jgi:two-component system phosphate regulon response regulator PhoB/two-component system alkaline phosphatase synthesis response regulator PhoP/two-component system response regulator VicR